MGLWYHFKGSAADLHTLKSFHRALRCYVLPGRLPSLFVYNLLPCTDQTEISLARLQIDSRGLQDALHASESRL